MFTVTKIGANRLDLLLEGKLSTDEMRTGLDELIEKAEGIEHGKMLYQITDFHIPSLGALAVELKRLPTLLALIKNFDQAAVLADRQWLKTIGEMEGALFPHLDIRGYDLEQKSEAEAWLSKAASEA